MDVMGVAAALQKYLEMPMIPEVGIPIFSVLLGEDIV